MLQELKSAITKSRIIITSSLKWLAMPIISLGAQLLLELASSKAKKNKRYQTPPTALTLNHGRELIIGSFQPPKLNAVTWYYLILVEVGEPNMSGWSISIFLRRTLNTYTPSRVTLALSQVDPKTTEMAFPRRNVQYLSFAL